MKLKTQFSYSCDGIPFTEALCNVFNIKARLDARAVENRRRGRC